MKIHKTTSFLPHLLATVFTAGCWLPFWLGIIAWRRMAPAYKGRLAVA